MAQHEDAVVALSQTMKGDWRDKLLFTEGDWSIYSARYKYTGIAGHIMAYAHALRLVYHATHLSHITKAKNPCTSSGAAWYELEVASWCTSTVLGAEEKVMRSVYNLAKVVVLYTALVCCAFCLHYGLRLDP